jgi:ATP-dependent DNA helicase PIF1
MNDNIFQALIEKKNIAISGPGGVGKTFQINRIREYCEKVEIKYHVCASTGIAAVLIDGTTLHHWAGIKPYMVEKFQKGDLNIVVNWKKESTKRIASTKLLIIDEVSMIGKSLFELVDLFCKKIKKNNKPFGGIQIIVSFDMLQLSPVKDDYIFNSSIWEDLSFFYIYMTKTYRTSDVRFFELLGRARVGKLNKEDVDILKTRLHARNEEFENKGIKPTILYSHKVNVEKINFEEIKKLPGSFYNYKCKDALYKNELDITPTYTTQPPELSEYFEEMIILMNTFIEDEIFLKPMSQVMLTKNLSVEEGLVNGSRGVITSCEANGVRVKFCSKEKDILIPYCDFEYTDPLTKISFVRMHIPLQLAWSITIHKCVSEDTLLTIPGNGLVKIKQLECKNQQNNTIYSPENLQISGIYETKKIIEVYKGNVEDGIKFTSTFGYEITTSIRHPLLIFNKEKLIFEWKKAPEITNEDYIVIKRGTRVEGNYFQLNDVNFKKPYSKVINVPTYLNEDFGYFLGVMLGDGSISDKTYRFDLSGIDFDIIDKCVDILKEQFNITVEKHTLKERQTNTERIFFHCKQLKEVFSYIGYNFEKADKKQIPDCILSSPLSVQKTVIQGLYDTDGGVSNSCINFTTTSEIMGKQLQQMLLNMDIPVSRIVMRDEVVDKNWKKAYRLNISGKSALKFVKDIGFKCKRKIDMSSERFYDKETDRKNNNSQSFEIPNGYELINKLRDEMQYCTKRTESDKITHNGHKLLSAIINKKQKLRCESLICIINEINNISQYPTGKLLSFIYNNGVLIDTVRNIEHVNNIQMYDIGVSPLNTSGFLPDGHDFIGNGFVNHNCQGQTLEYAKLDLGKNIFCPGQSYVALSRMKSLEGMILLSFDEHKVFASEEALDFDQKIRNESDE